ISPSTIAQRASTVASTTTTSLVLAKPTGIALNDRLIAQIAVRGKAAVTAPVGWVLVDNRLTGGTLRQVVLTRVAGASEPAKYTFKLGTATTAVGGLTAYANVAAVNLASAASGSGKAMSLSATIAKDATKVLSLYAAAAKVTVTVPAGMAH